jgi:hypothetical protein
MTDMNPTELIRSVDHVTAMNDRWLFVASLVVFGVFAAFVMRYFVRQHERLIDDDRQALDTYPKSLCGVVAEQSARMPSSLSAWTTTQKCWSSAATSCAWSG